MPSSGSRPPPPPTQSSLLRTRVGRVLSRLLQPQRRQQQGAYKAGAQRLGRRPRRCRRRGAPPRRGRRPSANRHPHRRRRRCLGRGHAGALTRRPLPAGSGGRQTQHGRRQQRLGGHRHRRRRCRHVHGRRQPPALVGSRRAAGVRVGRAPARQPRPRRGEGAAGPVERGGERRRWRKGSARRRWGSARDWQRGKMGKGTSGQHSGGQTPRTNGKKVCGGRLVFANATTHRHAMHVDNLLVHALSPRAAQCRPFGHPASSLLVNTTTLLVLPFTYKHPKAATSPLADRLPTRHRSSGGRRTAAAAAGPPPLLGTTSAAGRVVPPGPLALRRLRRLRRLWRLQRLRASRGGAATGRQRHPHSTNREERG